MSEMTSGLVELAEHHEREGARFAKFAMSNAPWKHDHAADVARASNHFEIAAALRSIAARAPLPAPPAKDTTP